jgi:hypothetical protein
MSLLLHPVVCWGGEQQLRPAQLHTAAASSAVMPGAKALLQQNQQIDHMHSTTNSWS